MAISTKRNRLHMEILEDRTMFDGGLAAAAFDLPTYEGGDVLEEAPVAVPAYSSNPDAPAAIYLDFNGHYEEKWGAWQDAITPVFDLDGNPDDFSDEERRWIHETWQYVAEDFAPFNVNVTTVNPGDFSNGKALRVAIGGRPDDWYYDGVKGTSTSYGTGYIDSFTNSISNTVYVFPFYKEAVSQFPILDKEVLRLKTSAHLAQVASHEVGHAFGLKHQSLVDENGVVIDETHDGTNEILPIMSNKDASLRTVWWNGTASNKIDEDADGNAIYETFPQDDMEVIASDQNGFGYRTDDHSDIYNSATTLGSISYTPGELQGIIEQTSDSDWFRFDVSYTSNVEINVQVAEIGANLDAKLDLFRAYTHTSGKNTNVFKFVSIASADPSNSLGVKLTLNLDPGTYYARVSSHGDYGDVGQYTISAGVNPFDDGGGGIFKKKPRSTSKLLTSTVEEPTSEPVLSQEVIAEPTSSIKKSRTSKQTSTLAVESLVETSDNSYESAVDELFSRDDVELLFAPSIGRLI